MVHMTFDGLRELKKRETRQRISNVATEMFLERGFDAVAVTEVAAASGVSEKTVYNYFPTKESLVLDQIQGQIERLIGAVRDRARGVSPSAALVAALKEDSKRFYEMIPADQLPRIEEFSAMVHGTPALRSAWSEHRHKLVEALTQVLADELQVDCMAPEPLTAARALVGLVELLYDSRLRHAHEGANPREVQVGVDADIDRAARLLDTGMWSLQLMVEGRRSKDQIREAAIVAEHARQQVLTALRGAKRSWKDAREEARAAGHEVAREARQQAAQAARQAAMEAKRAGQQAAHEARQQAAQAARDAAREAKQASREIAREVREQAREAAREAREQERR
jgi:AcrR family transcriptional regulator